MKETDTASSTSNNGSANSDTTTSTSETTSSSSSSSSTSSSTSSSSSSSSTDTTTSDESEESTEAGDTPIDSNDPANAADGSEPLKLLLEEPFDAFLDKRFGKDRQSFKPANPLRLFIYLLK